MYIVESYTVAVFLTFITMLCWGSWANTQKLTGKTWRFELFYWDYVIGIIIFSLLIGFTLGSMGEKGTGFIDSIKQANWRSISSAVTGGIIFNLANILVVAAIAIAGMAIAFPVGIGIAMVVGVITNYIVQPKGNTVLLFIGVGLAVLAIVLDAYAYRKLAASEKKTPTRGILLSIAGGLLMGLFYRFVAASISPDQLAPTQGMLTPYSAFFFFMIGIVLSNFVFNTYLMARPIEGAPVKFSDYFKGEAKNHLAGVAGGIVWAIGTSLSIIAAARAGYAISFGLGQGATMIGAFWGVFIWKEFRNAPRGTNYLLALMFISFIAGLVFIIISGR